jgi:AAA ATPase domain
VPKRYRKSIKQVLNRYQNGAKMVLKINYLEIENFKGVTHARIDLGGKSAIILGKNGIGKTTIADAFYWLLTDADSHLQTRFAALTLDDSGAEIPQQDAVVTAEIVINDGKPLRITKSHRQKWVKKRGAAMAEMTGHTTEYFFDLVPVSKKAFGEKLSEILPVDLVRLLSDPHHFCARLKPEDRRKILIDLAGDIDLSNLPDVGAILDGHILEDARSVLLAERKKSAEQLDLLPARIDELTKLIPAALAGDRRELEAKIAQVTVKINELDRQIAALESGAAIGMYRKALSDIDAALAATENDEKRSKIDAEMEVYDRISKERQLKKAAVDQMQILTARIEGLTARKSEFEKEREALADEWRKIRGEKFSPAATCFACGQVLPQDKIKSQIDAFNLQKAGQIENIDFRGNALSKRINDLIAQKDRLSEEFMAQAKAAETHDLNITKLEKELQAARTTPPSEKIKLLLADKAAAEKMLVAACDDIGPQIDSLKTAQNALYGEKAELEAKLLEHAQAEKAGRRIEERRADLKVVAAEYEEIEAKLFALEEYERAKSGLVEQAVNKYFELITWKLFEPQINGGIRAVCEATVRGIDYNTDLNTGMKIKAGLDAIKALQDHYETRLPIFVDNAESVTDWDLDLDGDQVIRLTAAANIHELEVIF